MITGTHNTVGGATPPQLDDFAQLVNFVKGEQEAERKIKQDIAARDAEVAQLDTDNALTKAQIDVQTEYMILQDKFDTTVTGYLDLLATQKATAMADMNLGSDLNDINKYLLPYNILRINNSLTIPLFTFIEDMTIIVDRVREKPEGFKLYAHTFLVGEDRQLWEKKCCSYIGGNDQELQGQFSWTTPSENLSVSPSFSGSSFDKIYAIASQQSAQYKSGPTKKSSRYFRLEVFVYDDTYIIDNLGHVKYVDKLSRVITHTPRKFILPKCSKDDQYRNDSIAIGAGLSTNVMSLEQFVDSNPFSQQRKKSLLGRMVAAISQK